MKVFVTGGTGFVGSEVLQQLAAANHEVVALVRPGSESKLVKSDQIVIYSGDVNDFEKLSKGIAGCDAVIHLVGIIREIPKQKVTFERVHVEATRSVIKAAVLAKVKRYVHMSANGARANSNTDYHRTKWQAEEIVRSSKLDWTIIRPSLIFGAGGEFVEMLAGMIRKLPVVPVIGDGQYRMQPVAIRQVGATYLKALSLKNTIHESYELGGSESYTFDQILDLTGKALGRKTVHKIHQPVGLVRPMVNLLESFKQFPLTSDQLAMMLEGNECDQTPWAETFEIEPISFAEGIADCFTSDE